MNSLLHSYFVNKKYDDIKQDMLNIVLIGLAKKLPRQDEKHELHRLLGALLSKSLTQSGKLNIIEKEYDIPLEEDLERIFRESEDRSVTEVFTNFYLREWRG